MPAERDREVKIVLDLIENVSTMRINNRILSQPWPKGSGFFCGVTDAESVV